MNWKENGEGCFCLKHECLFCGQKFENEIAKSIGIERELTESGYDHEFASLMAWGDIDAVSQSGAVFKQ